MKSLHPATMVIELLRFFRAWLVPLLLILFVARSGESFASWIWIPFIGAVISATATVARFVSFRYGVRDDRLVIQSGILFHQARTIPLSQIQNVHLKSGPVHRLFGVVEVRVETASSGLDSEAHLSVVGRRDAEVFRTGLLDRRGVPVAEEAKPPSDVVWRSSLGDLLLAGATENRVGVLIAGLFALYEIFEDFGDALLDPLQDALDRLFGAGPLATALAAVAALLFLIVGGWIGSIFFTLLTYFGFHLRRDRKELRKQHGLFTRYEAAIPLQRVQVVRIEANALRRLFGRAAVKLDTAGSAKQHEEGGTTILCPITRLGETPSFARLVFPDADLERVSFRPVHPLARRRGFVRLMIPMLLAQAVLAMVLGPVALTALPGIVALAALLARARYRAIGWAHQGRYLFARAGVWTRRHWILPEGKVQTVTATQSPVQRWLGLGTLSVATAGAGALSRVHISDLAAKDAEELLEALSFASAQTGSRTGI